MSKTEKYVASSSLPLRVRWVAEHTQYEPPNLFVDTQISGPFAEWNHRHEFEPVGRYTSLHDRIEYRVPLGAIGRLFGAGKALATLEAMFAFRHRLTRDDLTLQADRPTDPLRVAVSGSTGLVGSQLCSLLTLLGHQVRPIVRGTSSVGDSQRDVDVSGIAVWESQQEAAKLADVDAVVHLAGKPIIESRWSDEVKQQIRDSRVIKTRELCESLARLPSKPGVLICASASGYYGNRGDEVLDEASSAGDDFLAGVVKEWEEACKPAIDAGIRVVHARLGIALSPRGGALQKMLLPAKLAGGSLGSGDQWMSWMALDDVIGAIYHAITDESLSGPVNLVAPEAVTNRDFTKALGGVLGRPALIPAPSPLLRAAMGEAADALLLSSTRVKPTQLMETGYRFRFTDLGDFLRYALGRERLESAE